MSQPSCRIWVKHHSMLLIAGFLGIIGPSPSLAPVAMSKEAEPASAPVPLAKRLLREPPPLPEPRGPVVRVTTVDGLFRAVASVPAGGTIVVAPGRYILPRRLEIRQSGVTLRGATGRPGDVVLDGGPHRLGELLAVHGCSDVVIAYMTIENVRWNGIKLDTDAGTHRVSIYHCVIHNVWQRGVKGVKVPRTVARPEGCRIQYCIFYNDRAKSYQDDPTDTEQTFRGNYIGGIDVMFARKWVISDNVFYNIQGRTREGRGAIFLWHEAEDCLVERNVIVNCDVGIALGNSYKPEDVETHASRVIVRNNFVVSCPETGILADYTRDCLIAHNTIYDPSNRLGRLIRLVHDNSGLMVANNLLVGPDIRNESPSRISFLTNKVLSRNDQVLADAARGDLHLTGALPEIVDRGMPIDRVREDFDGEERDGSPDIGADEWREAHPPSG